jgi:hypothetical protein
MRNNSDEKGRCFNLNDRRIHRRPSGLTVAAYCRDLGIKGSAFYARKRRLRSMPISGVTHADLSP